MHSHARPVLQSGKIEVLNWPIIVTDHFEKLERGCMPGTVARTQRSEGLVDCSVFMASGYGDEHASGMVAKRTCKVDFLLRGQARGVKIGRAELRDQLHREQVDDRPAILFACFDNLRQRRTAQRLQSQEPGTECG